jgi:3-hydroxybutyryl-CoA dehydrogenase
MLPWGFLCDNILTPTNMEACISVDKKLHIGIAGTGAIAVGFAALFSGNGYKTTVIGRTDASLIKIRDSYARIFDVLKERKLVNQGQRKKCEALVSYSTSFKDLADAEIVFEAVYEDAKIKFNIYKQIEANCPKIKAIASATSALSPDDLKKGFVKLRTKFLVAHPFNPPHLVPLVELVGSDETSKNAIKLTKEFFDSCGRKTIVMGKSAPGFIANRLQHAMIREALYLVHQGIATPADIDTAITWSFAPRYTKVGLLQHNDGYGLDQLEGLSNYLYPHLCADKKASPVITESVKKGNLGQKTGKGFHAWDEKKIAEFRRGAAEPYWHFFNWNLP